MAVIRLCLDTSAYSRLMRGQPKLQERLELADEILLPATMLGEVYRGLIMHHGISMSCSNGSLGRSSSKV